MEPVIYDHPLIKNKVAKLRDKNTEMQLFRETTNELAGLMCYEVTKDLKTKAQEVETPLSKTTCEVLAQDVVIVPILRAGLGMVDAVQLLIPHARVGHIGLYRGGDDASPNRYYAKLPNNLENSLVLLLDPMLATGGTLKASVEILKERGAKDIRYVGIVGCPEGLAFVEKHCPDVKVYLASLDERLNEDKYIVPGLGDAGDRLFGTK